MRHIDPARKRKKKRLRWGETWNYWICVFKSQWSVFCLNIVLCLYSLLSVIPGKCTVFHVSSHQTNHKVCKKAQLSLTNVPCLLIHVAKESMAIHKCIRSMLSAEMTADGLSLAQSLFVVLHCVWLPPAAGSWMGKYPVGDCWHAWQRRATPFSCLCRAACVFSSAERVFF